jgi:Domain of unknown function (DUF5655)
MTGARRPPWTCPYPVHSPRFVRVSAVVPGWWSHHLRVSDPQELDDEVQAWLRESYRLMGMQERLKAGAPKRQRRLAE